MSNTGIIYLDNMATTPIDPQVQAVMYESIANDYGNPSSTHALGLKTRHHIEQARAQVAGAIGAPPECIIWTSGATEADNLAIIGAAQFYQPQCKHIIVEKIAHKAILQACEHLAKLGFQITYLEPQANGLINLDTLNKAITPDTGLISVMHVHNELGTIQDIAAIARLAKQHGILLHVDCAQSIGKVHVNIADYSDVALMSFSAHKAYGPKGIGALYCRMKPRVRLQAQTFGGGQERGYRAGTLATHQIIAMGKAFELATQNLDADIAHAKTCRDELMASLTQFDDIIMHTDIEHSVAQVLNVAIPGIDAKSLMSACKTLAFSTGAACSAHTHTGSHVLNALNISLENVKSSIRLSYGRQHSLEDIRQGAAVLCKNIQALRAP